MCESAARKISLAQTDRETDRQRDRLNWQGRRHKSGCCVKYLFAELVVLENSFVSV